MYTNDYCKVIFYDIFFLSYVVPNLKKTSRAATGPYYLYAGTLLGHIEKPGSFWLDFLFQIRL